MQRRAIALERSDRNALAYLTSHRSREHHGGPPGRAPGEGMHTRYWPCTYIRIPRKACRNHHPLRSSKRPGRSKPRSKLGCILRSLLPPPPPALAQCPSGTAHTDLPGKAWKPVPLKTRYHCTPRVQSSTRDPALATGWPATVAAATAAAPSACLVGYPASGALALLPTTNCLPAPAAHIATALLLMLRKSTLWRHGVPACLSACKAVRATGRVHKGNHGMQFS